MRVLIQRFEKVGFDFNFKPIIKAEPSEIYDRSFPDDKKGEKALHKFCEFFRKDQESKANKYLMKVEFQQEQTTLNFNS